MSEQHSERVIEGEARPGWGRVPVTAVVVVSFLLAAIVGMTSAATPWLSGDGNQSSPPAIVGQLLAVALAVGCCVLLGLAWIHTPRRVRRKRLDGSLLVTDELGSSLRTGSFVSVCGILAALMLIVAFWLLLGPDAGPPSSPTGGTTLEGADAPRPEPPPSAPASLDWFLFGLVASIAVVVPLAVIARRRQWVSDDPQLEEGEVPESIVRAVGESIDQIERDPDARRAIIRAYAQMEHAFDDAGIPRRPHEAPFEYLGRALRRVRVSPPAAGRLAALFERARFSQHMVDAETKHDAIGALREIERELEEPSP